MSRLLVSGLLSLLVWALGAAAALGQPGGPPRIYTPPPSPPTFTPPVYTPPSTPSVQNHLQQRVLDGWRGRRRVHRGREGRRRRGRRVDAWGSARLAECG